jgi:SHS family lactate transporter-like MFS transporter
VLDGFDFTLLTFILIDIQRSFTIDAVLAGALGTVTMLMRLVGGISAGAAADRWGRKGPLMLSILWFSIFSLLSGFSTSYAMLFAFRALFGIGMGGEWAAGMPLALEQWPQHLRGIGSGMLQSGWPCGFILSAFAFQYIYPVFSARPDLGWRAMFWIGVLPALLVLWIRSGVGESPVWLARQAHLKKHRQKDEISLLRILKPDLIRTTIHTSVVMGAFIFSNYSATFWYPTFLREAGFSTFSYLMALNIGTIAGSLFWGVLSETSLGRRGAVSIGGIMGVLAVPLFLLAHQPILLLTGALLVGIGGPGMWGVVPGYLTERFPTAARGVGPGFAYHVGAGLGSGTPTLIGALKNHGVGLGKAMAVCLVIANLMVVSFIWLGPEPRGRKFTAID